MEQRRFGSGNMDSGRRDSRGGGRRFGSSGGRSSGGFGGRRFGGQRRFGGSGGSGFRRRDNEGDGQSRGGGRFFGSSRGGFGRSGGGFNKGPPREMHKAVCSKCKKDCEVPFKPTQGKPVFCRECFQKKQEEEGY